MSKTPDAMSLDHLESCAAACSHCAKVCLKTLHTSCLQLGGIHVRLEHVQLMTDCVMICNLAADFMIRQSARHLDICTICADLCEECATDCESMTGMEECAHACRQCADSCRSMIQMTQPQKKSRAHA